LQLVPAVLPVLVDRHAHEGQLEVRNARHSDLPLGSSYQGFENVFKSKLDHNSQVVLGGKQLHSKRKGWLAGGLAGGWPGELSFLFLPHHGGSHLKTNLKRKEMR